LQNVAALKGSLSRKVSGIFAGIMLVFTTVSATAEDCILDRCADQQPLTTPAAENPESQTSQPRRQQVGGAIAPGAFDFYVLALSWSSGFCQTSGAARNYGSPAYGQCAPGAGRGFVVHGLWPQNLHGYPSDCGPMGRSPSRIALETVADLYPDEGLARHEWRTHGTCSGKSPTDYFADVRRAREGIVIPPPFQSAGTQQSWTRVDLERAFIAANPGLLPGMLSVACNKNIFTEIRICLSKDLRNFHTCPEVSREGCHAREISVPPVL
jgi:ribonuclease T2